MPRPPGTPLNFHMPFSEVDLEEVWRLALLGATDKEIAEIHIGVPLYIFTAWLQEHNSLVNILYEARQGADNRVAVAMYQRACGYSHPETDIKVIDGEIVKTEIIKHYPPDPVSFKFWMTNRQGKLWNDMKRVEHSGPDGAAMRFHVDTQVEMNPIDLANRLRLYIEQQQVAALIGDPEVIEGETE